ncbi:MAG TPA: helix-hairpin-helix domain-containing protein [Rhodopila sp.]|nr:helix-hairpin-helix domain-containing protein [Rhodopila sp.]
MTFTRIGLAGVIASMLAMPVMAQTTQTSPQRGTTSVPTAPPTTPAPGMPAPGMPARTATNPGMAPRAGAPSGPVNINTASAAELDALPGIGKARADAIIKNRPYKSPDELSSRHILPSNVYNKIKNDLVARPG